MLLVSEPKAFVVNIHRMNEEEGIATKDTTEVDVFDRVHFFGADELVAPFFESCAFVRHTGPIATEGHYHVEVQTPFIDYRGVRQIDDDIRRPLNSAVDMAEATTAIFARAERRPSWISAADRSEAETDDTPAAVYAAEFEDAGTQSDTDDISDSTNGAESQDGDIGDRLIWPCDEAFINAGMWGPALDKETADVSAQTKRCIDAQMCPKDDRMGFVIDSVVETDVNEQMRTTSKPDIKRKSLR